MKIDVTCFSTAGGADRQPVGDALVGEPLGHQREHLALARREVVERVLPAAAAEHPRDHLGVERRPAAARPSDRLDEVAEVGDAVLEQVADAARVVADELGHEALDEVLGEHEHADLGLLAPDLDRRPQPVVGEVRRHPDVDDRDVGPVRRRPCAAGRARRPACPTTSMPASSSSRATPSRSSSSSSAITARTDRDSREQSSRAVIAM